MNKYQEILRSKLENIKMNMNKKYILTIAVSVIFAGLIGFYAGRYFEIHTARQRFTQMKASGTQGQRFQRNQGFGGGPDVQVRYETR